MTNYSDSSGLNTTSDLKEARRLLNVKRNELIRAKSRLKEEETELAKIQGQTKATEQAQEFLQELAQNVQQQAHEQIARVVSRCLGAVFEDQYELEINFVKTRGRTEAVLGYRKSGHRVSPSVDSGGVQELAALALRLASLVLSVPVLDRVLDLDEPFSGVSATNLPKVAALLKTLSAELGVQFIIRTHLRDFFHETHLTLEIGKVIHLT